MDQYTMRFPAAMLKAIEVETVTEGYKDKSECIRSIVRDGLSDEAKKIAQTIEDEQFETREELQEYVESVHQVVLDVETDGGRDQTSEKGNGAGLEGE